MAAMIRLCLAILFTLFTYISFSDQAPAVGADPPLEVIVSLNGSYQIKVKGAVWLNSAPTFFVVNNQRYSLDDGSLTVAGVNSTTFTQSDFGDGTKTSIYFQAGNVSIVGSIMVYEHNEKVSFKVDFPDGVTGINHINFDATLCGFPGFIMDGDVATLGFLSLGGEYAGFSNQMVGRWNKTANLQGGLEGSAPLNLFDKSFNALTIGPMDNFMASSLWRDIDNDHVYWGIMSGVTEIPLNFSYQVFMAYANDVTQSMHNWGVTLSAYYYKKIRLIDETANKIGYWTGEGSFYYDEPTGFANYEDMLIDVFKAAENRSIPYGYVQLDNWWFTKGQGGGVKEWTAPTDVFPNGQQNLQSKLKVPFVAVNNFWSNDTVYATQNGGDYQFDLSDDMALPKDQAFWEKIFEDSKNWGMTTYIQENMTEIFRQFDDMKTSLTYGHNWLVSMGSAAAQKGITIQYSGAIPRIILSALEIPAVTQIRASPNYGANPDQWKIGLTSIFISALQVRVSKDGLLSQVHEEGKGDPNAERQGLVSSLTQGTYETGDEAWKTNTTFVMKSCLQDGTLLKPHLPIMAVDAQLLEQAFQDGIGPKGEVWSTYTDVTKIGQVGPSQTFGIIFASNLEGSYAITPSKAGFTFEYPRSKIYSAKDPRVQHDFSEEKPFTMENCPADDYCLYYTAPVIDFDDREIMILGELDKWIPIARERIANITLTDVITIDVKGSPNERVEIWFSVNGEIAALAIRVGADGVGSLVFEDKKFNAAPSLRNPGVFVLTLIGLVLSAMWTKI